MFTLTVEYGGQQASKQWIAPPTVAEVRRDRDLRAELGYGDNCKLLINGVEQPDTVTVPVPFVRIETAANQKAH